MHGDEPAPAGKSLRSRFFVDSIESGATGWRNAGIRLAGIFEQNGKGAVGVTTGEPREIGETATGAFRLGAWHVDPLYHTLSQGNQELQIPAKVMAVLEYIARHHERLVTREELIEAVWQGNDFVGERALNNAIWRIRRALNDSSDSTAIVKTVPKKGYQLLLEPQFDVEAPRRQARARRVFKSPRLIAAAAGAVLIAAALLVVDGLPMDDRNGAGLSVFVALPGRELYPAPSPDGRYVAFLSVSLQGDRDIYLKDVLDRTRPLKRVTYSDLDEVSPSWSADSKHLAFLRIDPTTSACRVVVINLKSRDEEVANDCVHREYAYDTLSWSPDGRWLVHRADVADKGPGLYLWRVDLTGVPAGDGAPRRISCRECKFVDQEVSWSPDSRRLAVTRRHNRLSADIYTYDLESGEFTRATTGERSIKGHAWYRDGERLLYVSNPGPRHRQLWLLDTASGEKRALGVPNAGFPAFTADFESVVLYRREADTFVSLLRLGGDGPQQLPMPVVQTANADRSPTYDPVHDRVAYISNASGNDEIWVVGFDGTGPLQVTDFGRAVEDPVWSPDGLYLAFVLLEPDGGTNNLKLLDMRSGQVRTVPTGFENHGPPSWAANGRSLIVPVWSDSQVDLWRISPDGEQRERLTRHGGEFGREDPSGQAVYFTRPNTVGLYRVNSEGEESLVTRDWSDAYGWANWDWYSRDEIVLSRTAGESMLVSLFNIADKRFTPLVRLPLRTIHRHGKLDYVAAHDAILFTNRELPQIDLWTMPNPLD